MDHAIFDTEHSPATNECRGRTERESKIRSSQGQVLVEFACVLPLLLLLAFGVIELSFLMHDQHILIRLTREGSNLISRDTKLGDAATAMTSMVNPPVDLTSANSKLIFTVLTNYSGSGPNNGKVIVYQRREIGSLTAASVFNGSLSSTLFDSSTPDYYAINPGANTNLQLAIVPANLVLALGQSVYVTEIYTRHSLITALDIFGVSLPTTLYSIAYF